MNEHLSLSDVETLARDVLIRSGTSASNAEYVAHSIRLAEQDGLRDAGLATLPGIVEHLRCGRVDGQAIPTFTRPKPAAFHVDANGGFACPAFGIVWDDLAGSVQGHGIAIVSICNSYPLSVPAQITEYCATLGMVGLCFATTRARRAGTGDIAAARHIALATPGPSGPVQIIKDCASSGSALAAMVHLLASGFGAALPDRAIADYQGPLGGPFLESHTLIAISPELFPPGSDTSAIDKLFHQTCADTQDASRTTTRNRAEEAGVYVPFGLLEKIINA